MFSIVMDIFMDLSVILLFQWRADGRKGAKKKKSSQKKSRHEPAAHLQSDSENDGGKHSEPEEGVGF